MNTARGVPLWRRRAIWVLGVSVSLVLMLILGGTVKEFALARRHSPAGRLIDIGGISLHINCSGHGSLTVVIETGSGSWSGEWALVQTPLAQSTRVCTYDRAGYGWSDESTGPRSGDKVIDELHALLDNADEDPPYLLVGHSLGGLYVRLFAHRYPEETAGMVLVDARPEEYSRRVPQQSFRPEVFAVPRMLARLNILQLVGPYVIPATQRELLDRLPDDIEGATWLVKSRTACFDSIMREAESIPQLEEAVRGARLAPELPLAVITHGRVDEAMLPPDKPLDAVQESERIWQELQREMKDLSTIGQLVVAKESGHHVMLDQPELIVNTVMDLLISIRQQFSYTRWSQ